MKNKYHHNGDCIVFYWQADMDPMSDVFDVYVWLNKADNKMDARTLSIHANDWDTCLKDIEVCPSSGLTVGDVPGLFYRLTDALDARWDDITVPYAEVMGEIVVLNKDCTDLVCLHRSRIAHEPSP